MNKNPIGKICTFSSITTALNGGGYVSSQARHSVPNNSQLIAAMVSNPFDGAIKEIGLDNAQIIWAIQTRDERNRPSGLVFEIGTIEIPPHDEPKFIALIEKDGYVYVRDDLVLAFEALQVHFSQQPYTVLGNAKKVANLHIGSSFAFVEVANVNGSTELYLLEFGKQPKVIFSTDVEDLLWFIFEKDGEASALVTIVGHHSLSVYRTFMDYAWRGTHNLPRGYRYPDEIIPTATPYSLIFQTELVPDGTYYTYEVGEMTVIAQLWGGNE